MWPMQPLFKRLESVCKSNRSLLIITIIIMCIHGLIEISTPRNPAASRRCFVADCSAAFKKSQAIWWPLAETASGHLVVVKSKRHGTAFHPVTAIRGNVIHPADHAHWVSAMVVLVQKHQAVGPRNRCLPDGVAVVLLVFAPALLRQHPAAVWAGSPWHRGRHETWPKQPQSLLKRIHRFQADAAWEPRHLNLNGYG